MADQDPEDVRRWLAYMLDPGSAGRLGLRLCGGCHSDWHVLRDRMDLVFARAEKERQVGVAFIDLLDEHLRDRWSQYASRIRVPED